MSEKEAYSLDFEAPAPKTERKGIRKVEYDNTVEIFLKSKKDYAVVKIPSKEKLSNVQIGLKTAIKRMGKSDEVKPIRRKGNLYLITKAYSDKQGWTWEITRTKKTKESSKTLGKKQTISGKP